MKHLLHLSPVIFKAQFRISSSLSVAQSSSNSDIAPLELLCFLTDYSCLMGLRLLIKGFCLKMQVPLQDSSRQGSCNLTFAG